MPCKKYAYPSRADAKRASDKCAGVKLRVYQCPLCLDYHLTSMTSREMRAARKRQRKIKKLSAPDVIIERSKIEEERSERRREYFDKLVLGNIT